MLSRELRSVAFGTEKLIDVGHEIVMREHDSFWQSGRPAGVGENGEGLVGSLCRFWESRRGHA